MGKSSNGPDVTDIATMMSAMESLHECRVGCLITTGGQGHNGIVQIELKAAFDVLPGSSMPKEIVARSEFPCKECSNIEGHVFRGLYALDFLIGEAYQQRCLLGIEQMHPAHSS